MKSLLTFIGVLLIAIPLRAQITFDQGDYPKPGITIEYYEGWSDSVDMGSAGANQVFDFSKIIFGMQDTFKIEFLDPANTPYPTAHPNSTVAFLEDIDKDSLTGITVLEDWVFMQVTSDNSYYDGVTFNVDTAYLFSQATPSSMESFHSDYDPKMEFVGSTWTYQAIKRGSTNFSLLAGNLKHVEILERNIEIDAWGIFKNPWHTFEALRFKVEEFAEGIDSLNGQQIDTWSDTTYYYEYWIKGLGYYIARAYTDDTYVNLWGYEAANQRIDLPVGVNESTENFGLNVYPIPVRDVLNIEINVTDILEYEIRNLNGSLVVWGILPSESGGHHQLNVSALNSGMYILNIKSENQVIGKEKFIVK